VSVGPSPQFGLRVMTRAFGRFAHTLGYVCLAGVFLEVVGYQTVLPHSGAWLALIPLVITIFALVLLDRRQTSLFSVFFLAVGGLSLFWFASILFAEVPTLVGSGEIIFSYFDVALIFVGGSGVGALSGVLWCSAAYVVTQAATLGAALRAGRAIRLDPASTLIEAGLVVAIIALGASRARAQRARPRLDRAAMDEETSAMRYRIELKAAALMHDTVLGHLAAVAAARPGELRADLTREIERDLEVLIGEEWLSDVSPDVDSRAKSDWRQSALLAAIQQAREQALAVEVTGDFAAVGRLTAERDSAVGLAVKQCLVNVLRHAQIDRAEVIIIGSERDVSVMVIDTGRGFSEAHVGADRLGIRQSVRRRIEAVGGDVKVWSRPGRGTSVLIRVPATIAWEESSVVPHASH
jgi:signal transduction histidine kinase